MGEETTPSVTFGDSSLWEGAFWKCCQRLLSKSLPLRGRWLGVAETEGVVTPTTSNLWGRNESLRMLLEIPVLKDDAHGPGGHCRRFGLSPEKHEGGFVIGLAGGVGADAVGEVDEAPEAGEGAL